MFTQPWPAGPTARRRDQVIYYEYKADRARRTLRGIDEQATKAEQAVAGKAPVKRNRFIRLSGGTWSANRELEEKAKALAGLKGHVTNLATCPGLNPGHCRVRDRRLTISSSRSRKLRNGQKRSRQGRLIYDRTRDSIEAATDHRLRGARPRKHRQGGVARGSDARSGRDRTTVEER